MIFMEANLSLINNAYTVCLPTFCSWFIFQNLPNIFQKSNDAKWHHCQEVSIKVTNFLTSKTFLLQILL